MKTCDYCDSDTLADDGDDFGEWRYVRDPSTTDGRLILCVRCEDDWRRETRQPVVALPRDMAR